MSHTRLLGFNRQLCNHNQGACFQSLLETALLSSLTSFQFLVSETQGNKIHGEIDVFSLALPPPAMPGSSIKVPSCGCPTGHRKPGPYNLMTSDCNAVRWSGGLVTQGTALKQGQAAKLSRTTFTRFSPIQHIYALYGHSHVKAVFFFTMTKGFNTGM